MVEIFNFWGLCPQIPARDSAPEHCWGNEKSKNSNALLFFHHKQPLYVYI
jgi:hypothetical protein